MYKWYADAEICYAYLSDLRTYGFGQLDDSVAVHAEPPTDQAKVGPYYAALAFGRSKWWTRGWTLQEVIAPKDVQFYDVEWNFVGYRSELTRLISDITNIDVAILNQTRRLAAVSIAKKMSWAAKRETSRIEDQAVRYQTLECQPAEHLS